MRTRFSNAVDFFLSVCYHILEILYRKKGYLDMKQMDFSNCRIVPVVVIQKLEDTLPTLQALCDGGVPVAEIAFRTACAADAIRAGVKAFPDMKIGASTVINAAQAREAIDAGGGSFMMKGDIVANCKKLIDTIG